MTSLATIRADSNPATFPVERLAGLKTAAAFFAAHFLGRHDVIHLTDAGLRVVAIDTDAEKLAEMANAYGDSPPVRVVADAYVHAGCVAAMHGRFDCVVADPWSNMIGGTLDQLGLFAAICDRLLVVGVSREWMEGRGLSYSAGDLQLWTVARELPLRVVELRERSNYLGGIAWGVWEVTR